MDPGVSHTEPPAVDDRRENGEGKTIPRKEEVRQGKDADSHGSLWYFRRGIPMQRTPIEKGV